MKWKIVMETGYAQETAQAGLQRGVSYKPSLSHCLFQWKSWIDAASISTMCHPCEHV